VAANGTWMRSSSASKHWLWRAVDQDGLVLEILRPEPARQEGRQNASSASSSRSKVEPLLCSSITDKLKSYAAAKPKIMPGVAHRQAQGPQ
jgi:putative transposase